MTDQNDHGKVKNRLSRREFIGASASAGIAGFTIMKPSSAKGFAANSKIEVGFIGLGGRGSLIASLMSGNHKGYKIVSAADYFEGVVNKAGEKFGVASNRRFSGLSGYRKLIESKVDAIFLETPPCFFPEHAGAGVEGGCHVYMAKPLACDVAGTFSIEDSGNKATKNKQVFLVDFQVPTNEFNIETVRQIGDGQIGEIGMLSTIYCDESFSDPPKTGNIESRLRHLIWVNDLDLGGGYIVNAGIHAVDAGLWVAGDRPVSAMGSSRQVGKHNGDSRNVYSITYQYKDGLIHNHRGEHIRNTHGFMCRCMVWGETGYAEIGYRGKAWLRGNKGRYTGGEVENLYRAGIEYNLSKFEKAIREKDYKNDTLKRSVDSNLATILGREAGMRNGIMTMDELIKEDKRYEVDTKGLKV